jgi:hypothetical protein
MKTALVTFKIRIDEEKFVKMNPDHSGKIKDVVVDFIEEIETIDIFSEKSNHLKEHGYEIMCENYNIK